MFSDIRYFHNLVKFTARLLRNRMYSYGKKQKTKKEYGMMVRLPKRNIDTETIKSVET